MEKKAFIRNLVWKIVKALWKLFLMCLWGALRLVEVFLHHFNNFLKSLIS